MFSRRGGKVLRKVLLIVISVLIVVQITIGIAVVWTGELHIEFFGARLRSKSVSSAIEGLILLVFLRILVSSGWRNFALAVVSALFGVLLVEGFLRIWDPPLAQPNLVQIHRASNVYDWELIPGASGVGEEGEIIRINAAGMRDHEYPIEKPPGVKRIAVLGDSFTFGMAVDLQDTYVKQLEDLLREQGAAVEVMNFGVIGYGMWQFSAVLEEKVLAYDPDVIVVGFFLDDVVASIPPYLNKEDWKGHNPFEKLFDDEPSVFYLANVLRNVNQLLESKYRYRRGHRYLQGIEERKQEIGPENSEHKFYKIQIGTADKAVYERFEWAVGQFADRVRGAGMSLVGGYIPDASQLHEPDRQYINGVLEAAAGKAGFELIDLTPRFEAFSDPRELYLFPLDAHTSPTGHRVIAEAIAEVLLNQGLLEP